MKLKEIITKKKIQLEIPCLECNNGWVDYNKQCEICNGTGKLISKFGFDILNFINRKLPEYRAQLEGNQDGKS